MPLVREILIVHREVRLYRLIQFGKLDMRMSLQRLGHRSLVRALWQLHDISIDLADALCAFATVFTENLVQMLFSQTCSRLHQDTMLHPADLPRVVFEDVVRLLLCTRRAI